MTRPILTFILLIVSIIEVSGQTVKEKRKELDQLFETVNQNFFSKNDRVEAQAEKGILLASSLGDSAKLADLYRMAGVIHYFNGQHDKALQYYFRALKMYQRQSNFSGEARTYNEIGTLYKKNKRLELSLQMFDNAYAAAAKVPDTANMATSISNSGIVYEMRNDLAGALERYYKSLELYKRIRDTVGLSYSHENIGGVYLMQKRFDDAELHLRTSLRFREAKGLLQAKAFSLHYLGELYQQKGDYSAALAMFRQCLVMAETMHYPDLQQRACFSLAEVNRQMGKYDEALTYFTKATVIKDSMYDAESSLRLAELQTRYEVDKKDKENLLLKQTLDLEAQRSKNRNLLTVFIVIIAIGMVGFGFVYFRRRQQLTAIQTRLKIQKAEHEQRLRISHDLHDHVGAQLSYVVSNLDIASAEFETGHIPANRLKSVTEMSKQAIHTLRETVWALNNESISVEAFSDKFKSYSLKMSEYSESIRIEFREDIQVNHILTPDMALHLFRICQEAFGNAMKHAAATRLYIEIMSGAGVFFKFRLTDNGTGFDEKATDLKGHYGLQNMRVRAREIHASFQLTSESGKGTVVEIELKEQ